MSVLLSLLYHRLFLKIKATYYSSYFAILLTKGFDLTLDLIIFYKLDYLLILPCILLKVVLNKQMILFQIQNQSLSIILLHNLNFHFLFNHLSLNHILSIPIKPIALSGQIYCERQFLFFIR